MRGLYLFHDGSVCVEYPEGHRLPMDRAEYIERDIKPAYGRLMTKLDFDAWLLGRKPGESLHPD